MFYAHHGGGGRWIFMVIVTLILLGLFVAFVLWLVQDRGRRPRHDRFAMGGTAAEILDRRLAVGEIGIPEYERLKASLASAPRSTPASGSEPPPPA